MCGLRGLLETFFVEGKANLRKTFCDREPTKLATWGTFATNRVVQVVGTSESILITTSAPRLARNLYTQLSGPLHESLLTV